MSFSDEPLFADVDAIEDRTSNASELCDYRSEVSDYRADFRDRIIERDGTCVCTDEEAEHCVACHILPHSKGDNVRF